MCRELQPPDPATHDEWLNFTKGQGSSRIPYPTLALDTDAWCQFPCGGRLRTPLTRLRLFSFFSPRGCNPGNREPWTFSSQRPTSKLFGPGGAARFLPFTFTRHSQTPRRPPKSLTCGRERVVQEEVHIMCHLVGHSFTTARPCNSWCTAASFHYLLNTTQTHHFVNSLQKKKRKEKRHCCTFVLPFLKWKSQHLPSFHRKMEEPIQRLLMCSTTAFKMHVLLFSRCWI